jgi:hypothetical protein
MGFWTEEPWKAPYVFDVVPYLRLSYVFTPFLGFFVLSDGLSV